MQNSLQMHHCTNPGQQKKINTKISSSSSSSSQKLLSSVSGGGCNNDGPLDALPKQFVASMKTLFDILDDQHTGYVKLIDIETGWQDDGSKGLPRGVIDSLRKVTPINGMLTFERFCAGLKICLLRNQTINNHHYHHNQSSSQQQQQQQQNINLINKTEKIRRLSSDNIINGNCGDNEFSTILNQPIRPPSAPLLDIDNPIALNQWNNTATVRPNNVAVLKGKQQQQQQQQQQQHQQQRTLSLPQLSPDSELELMQSETIDSIMQHRLHHCPVSKKIDIYGVTTISPPPPPKPPRSGIFQNGLNNTGIDKAEIRHALQNWQMGVLMNEMDTKEKTKILTNKINIGNSNIGNYNYVSPPIRGTADGGSIEFQTSSQSGSGCNLYPKKINVKRREPRRHTLQNGIDYNLLKRLKQFEGERDILLQGLASVENAKEWYLQQLSNVQEKIKYLGRMGSHVVQWSEVHQERLDFQRARILEINRHLSTLADIPVHMNLAVRPYQQISRGNCVNNKTSSTQPQLVEQRFKSNSQQQRHIIDDTAIKNQSDRMTMFECDNQLAKRSNRNNQIGVKLPSSNIHHTDVTF